MEPPPPAPSAPSAPPASETSAAARNGAPASARYEVLGHTLELEAKPGPCVLLHRPAAASAPGASAAGASAPGASAPGASAPRAVELGLTGPCYIMPWVKPPPPRDANGPSAAVPVGTTGDARAYTYENGVTVLLVIGGPPPPDQAERARGYTCAGDSRGVLLQGGEVRPSRRIAEGGSRLHCVEWGGPDEKEYWLFAHDPPGALTTPR